MRRATLTILMVMLTCTTSFAQKDFDWDALHKAWDTYISSPTPLHADMVNSLLPPRKCSKPGKIFTDQDKTLKVIERQVLKADKNTVALAFRLFPITDDSCAKKSLSHWESL